MKELLLCITMKCCYYCSGAFYLGLLFTPALTSSYALSATVNCGIMSVPSSVWNRLLIGIVVCPLFALNKIRIIINHKRVAWESVVVRPAIYHIL